MENKVKAEVLTMAFTHLRETNKKDFLEVWNEFINEDASDNFGYVTFNDEISLNEEFNDYDPFDIIRCVARSSFDNKEKYVVFKDVIYSHGYIKTSNSLHSCTSIPALVEYIIDSIGHDGEIWQLSLTNLNNRVDLAPYFRNFADPHGCFFADEELNTYFSDMSMDKFIYGDFEEMLEELKNYNLNSKENVWDNMRNLLARQENAEIYFLTNNTINLVYYNEKVEHNLNAIRLVRTRNGNENIVLTSWNGICGNTEDNILEYNLNEMVEIYNRMKEMLS